MYWGIPLCHLVSSPCSIQPKYLGVTSRGKEPGFYEILIDLSDSVSPAQEAPQ